MVIRNRHILAAAVLTVMAAYAAGAQASIGPDTATVIEPCQGGTLTCSAVVPVKIRAQGAKIRGALLAYRIDDRSPVRPPIPAKGERCVRIVSSSAPLIWRADTLMWARSSIATPNTENWCVSEAVTVLTLTDSATIVRIDQRRVGAAYGMKVTAPPKATEPVNTRP